VTEIYYRDLWGTKKREMLQASLDNGNPDTAYTRTEPTPANRYSLRPTTANSAYDSWPTLRDLAAAVPLNGLMEKRGGSLIEHERVPLERRMRAYFDPQRTWDDLVPELGGLGRDAARFPAKATRARALNSEKFTDRNLCRYFLRPFDTRWAYITTFRPIWNEPRPELVKLRAACTGFLTTRPAAVARLEGVPVAWTSLLGDNDALRGHAYYMPTQQSGGTANLSPTVLRRLTELGFGDPSGSATISALPWHHILAIAYASAWLAENADSIQQDWPRVPLPNNAELLRASAALGARVAALLDPDTPVPGVTAGTIEPALAAVAVPTKRSGRTMTEADRALTAGWGHAGKDGAVMPGRGWMETRDYAPDEAACKTLAPQLGDRTHDVFLNDDAYWRNFPETVWRFTIGGYQVVKKWLSYREQRLLGRALTPAEVRYVRDMARRLAALRLMGPELDANYRACAAAHVPLPRDEEA
jgi:Type ISP C-terminal specificity domain